MWVKKTLSFNRDRRSSSSSAITNAKKSRSLDINNDGESESESESVVDGKRRRRGGCFSFREVSIEPETASSLKEVDSSKLKGEIRRWAKAVVAYARQVSGRLGISKSNGSGRTNSGGDSYG